MSVETVFDVMELTRGIHRQLAENLDRCFPLEGQERVRMLMAYLSDHEARLDKVLKQVEEDTASGTLHTWMRDYLDSYPALKHLTLNIDCDVDSADDLLGKVLDLHEKLIGLYQYLAERTPVEAVREHLQSLMALEQHEAMRMARDGGRLNDL